MNRINIVDVSSFGSKTLIGVYYVVGKENNVTLTSHVQFIRVEIKWNGVMLF